MATVNSLLCFQGRTGATATMTVASPCVVTLTASNVQNGLAVVFTTTGALPTGISAGTTYYARYISADTFHLYDTKAHAENTGSTTGRVNTSGSQSGTHTIWSAYWYNLASGDRTRYGSAGSERVYSGLATWTASRVSAANTYDTEVLEICDQFVDFMSAQSINLPCAQTIIDTKVNGQFSPAFHFGVLKKGYVVCGTSSYATAIVPGIRTTVKNFSITALYYGATLLGLAQVYGCAENMIIYGGGPGQSGISLGMAACSVTNCVVTGVDNGFVLGGYGSTTACTISNCTVTKCTTGFCTTSGGVPMWICNNISVGNTTNWATQPLSIISAAYNAGSAGNSPWDTGTPSTAITTLAADDYTFVSYANDDYRPAGNPATHSSTAPQVDTGFVVVGAPAYDIAGAVRPSYKNGTATGWDIGAYEFDWGYGAAPATVNINITGIAAGSNLRIEKSSDGTEIVSQTVAGTSYSGTYTYLGDVAVNVILRKSSGAPKYKPYKTQQTITSSGLTLNVSQETDTIAT